LHWYDGNVKFIVRGKYWKQYQQSDLNNFNTTKDVNIYKDPEYGSCISVGVNVKHCQESILMNIAKFKTTLQDVFQQYQQNFRSNLEKTVVEMEQKVDTVTSGDMVNLFHRRDKCQTLLKFFDTNIKINYEEKIEGDKLHELLEYDPRTNNCNGRRFKNTREKKL
jgi:hypothetical protein